MERAASVPALLALALGGCSLIYNPSNLPAVTDAPPDQPADINPEALELARVVPSVLLEGTGAGGGRPAVLVIYGRNLAPGAIVAITAHAGQATTPSVMVDNARAVVDRSGELLAVPVTLNVDANIGPNAAMGRSIRLDVTVTQSGGTVTRTLAALDGDQPVATLEGLDELLATAALPTAAPHLFSRVDAPAISAADRTKPLIVRATSSIRLSGTAALVLSGADQNPGPGGFSGGDGGPAISMGAGFPGGGPGGGLTAGGGAGFAAPGEAGSAANSGGQMAGDAALTSWDTNRGSGGAGGNGSLLGVGGVGGGGGGALELSAGGDLTVAATIDVRGANGKANGGNNSFGGGGSGGAVLLRAGGAVSVAGVLATGGTGPSTGGDGAAGRIRLDARDPSAVVTSAMPAVGYRGPMFVAATPAVVTEDRPVLRVAGQAGSLFKYTIEGEDGTTLGPIETSFPGATGEVDVRLGMPLFPGLNKLCALVTGVTARRDEAENCITIAYLRP